jgi:hypothetical protein
MARRFNYMRPQLRNEHNEPIPDRSIVAPPFEQPTPQRSSEIFYYGAAFILGFGFGCLFCLAFFLASGS